MYIGYIILTLFSIGASVFFYLHGYEKGGRNMLDTLSLHGKASLLPIPYDSINEEFADHISKYILVLKEEHAQIMTNRKEDIYVQHGLLGLSLHRECLYKKDRERKAQ
jgi:hypothetical protein